MYIKKLFGGRFIFIMLALMVLIVTSGCGEGGGDNVVADNGGAGSDNGNTDDTPSDPQPLPTSPDEAPVIPGLLPQVVSAIKEIYAKGQTAGMRADVFAKVGDSITVNRSFLHDIGNGHYNVGSYSSLSSVIERFRAAGLADGSNSFNRTTEAGESGWGAEHALYTNYSSCSGITPVECEINAISPAYAIVMFGTNNIGIDYGLFYDSLNMIIYILVENGVIPIVSTVPEAMWDSSLRSEAYRYNSAIIELANKYNVPLVNYWKALEGLPNKGLSYDYVHPSVSGEGGGSFTDAALNYGYNVKALTFLQTLEKVLGAIEGG